MPCVFTAFSFTAIAGSSPKIRENTYLVLLSRVINLPKIPLLLPILYFMVSIGMMINSPEDKIFRNVAIDTGAPYQGVFDSPLMCGVFFQPDFLSQPGFFYATSFVEQVYALPKTSTRGGEAGR